MEFKIDEKVVVKANDEMYIVRAMNENNKMYACEGDYYGEPQLEVYHESELKKFETFIYPSTELTNGERTNIISRVSCSNKETVIKFEINRNIIKFNISKYPITLQGLLKILLNEININSYKYDRVSPFKMIHSYIDGEHKFRIAYSDLREMNTCDSSYLTIDDILKTNCNMQVVEGDYEMFIPNLIELAKFENVLIFGHGDKQEIKGLQNEMNRSKYLNKNKETYVNELIKFGFTIPERFNTEIENIDNDYLEKIVSAIDKSDLKKKFR